jgi:hypothetical protein
MTIYAQTVIFIQYHIFLVYENLGKGVNKMDYEKDKCKKHNDGNFTITFINNKGKKEHYCLKCLFEKVELKPLEKE